MSYNYNENGYFPNNQRPPMMGPRHMPPSYPIRMMNQMPQLPYHPTMYHHISQPELSPNSLAFRNVLLQANKESEDAKNNCASEFSKAVEMASKTTPNKNIQKPNLPKNVGQSFVDFITSLENNTVSASGTDKVSSDSEKATTIDEIEANSIEKVTEAILSETFVMAKPAHAEQKVEDAVTSKTTILPKKPVASKPAPVEKKVEEPAFSKTPIISKKPVAAKPVLVEQKVPEAVSLEPPIILKKSSAPKPAVFEKKIANLASSETSIIVQKQFTPKPVLVEQQVVQPPLKTTLIPLPSVETPIIGSIVDNRRFYKLDDLMSARLFSESCYIPEQLSIESSKDSYVRSTIPRGPKIQYRRSANAWVGAKERFKSLSKEDAQFEGFKVKIQMAINKFTQNTADAVLKELLSVAHDSQLIDDFIVDCVYRSVTRNGAWIKEYAKLCVQYNQQSKKTQHFKDEIIHRFYAGIELPQEWLIEHDTILNRKVVKLEDLDEKNEDLQFIERNQRLIVTGCAKFLAHLYMFDFVSDNDSISLIKKMATKTHELDIESICGYLTYVVSNIKSSASTTNFLKETVKKIDSNKKNYPMRVQFIVNDLVALYKDASLFKPTKSGISITTSQGPAGLKPNRNRNTVTSKDAYQAPAPSIGGKFQAFATNRGFKGNSDKKYTERTFNRDREREPSQIKKPQTFVKVTVAKETKPTQSKEFDYKTGKQLLLQILDIFYKFYDISKFICELKELEISNNMDSFVEIVLSFITDQTNIEYFYFGKFFHFLNCDGRLPVLDMQKGFSLFLSNFNDLVIEFPALSNVLATCILPFFTAEKMFFQDYYKTLVQAEVEDPINSFFDLFDELLKYTTIDTVIKLWRASSITDEKIKSLITEKYEFLVKYNNRFCVCATFNPVSHCILFENYPSLLKNLADASEEEVESCANSVIKLLHYYCPLLQIDVYTTRAISQHLGLFKVILNTPERVQRFFNQLKNIIVENCFLANNFIIDLTVSLIKEGVVEISAVQDIFSKIDQDRFNFKVVLIYTS